MAGCTRTSRGAPPCSWSILSQTFTESDAKPDDVCRRSAAALNRPLTGCTVRATVAAQQLKKSAPSLAAALPRVRTSSRDEGWTLLLSLGEDSDLHTTD